MDGASLVGFATAILNARATQIRQEYERVEAKLRSAAAGQLKKAADRVEQKASG